MEHATRLELFCRLFLGLFVGFFCVTAGLFVRYKAVNHAPQVSATQFRGASQAMSLRAPAKHLASASASAPASRAQPATPSLGPDERILITSSTSTLVTFIAAAVANVMSWRQGKRRRRGRARRVARSPLHPRASRDQRIKGVFRASC